MKYTLFVDKIIRFINRLGYCGALRFKIVKLIYDISERSNTRKGELEFVLQYLPDIRPLAYPLKNISLAVLDVGCNESLLIYELWVRGYEAFGLDQRDYHEKTKIPFIKHDITNPDINPVFNNFFYYIISLSAVEHIGLGAYGDTKIPNGDRVALENIYKLLRADGYFIITVPMKHWDGPTGRGYNIFEFKKLIKGLFDIFLIDQRHGQLCAVLTKSGIDSIVYSGIERIRKGT